MPRAHADAAPAQLRDHGYVVLRSFIDPAPLRTEVEHAMRDAFTTPRFVRGSAGNEFRYVPMMCERTPVSLALVQRGAAVACELLGVDVLPSRAKATVYRGDTRWHHDSDLPLTSVGFLAYLDPLDGTSGALRVRRGSHQRDVVGDQCPEVVLDTVPGDVIVFDEHLWHASSGGPERCQWRVDYVVDEGDDDTTRRAYYGAQYATGWDGGYDAERFPTYGPAWRALDARWNERLDELGAYAAAAAEEGFMRGFRRDDASRNTAD